ncbi:MAG TPA: response regulator transcription factor [Verrucomicrobiae bacterium]|nr:response regulator transcription factor [Verrucomicrobiae bacterium]
MTSIQPDQTSLSSAASEHKRIMIIDDHPMMRAGLMQLIGKQSGMAVCGEAGSPAEAMDLIAKCRPDLILVDISMKGASGLEFIKNVSALHGHIPMLVVSMHDEKVYAERAMRAGACGYIMKEESAEYLIIAIKRVLEGGVYLSKEMSARLLKALGSPQGRNVDSPLQRLTDREFEVFRLIGEGKTTEEIAQHLHISPKTVDVHRFQIKEKLHLASSTALVHYAVRWADSGS